MNFEKTEVNGFEAAIRGMRNPYDSHDKSDSFICNQYTDVATCNECRYLKASRCQFKKKYTHNDYVIGNNDIALCQKLIRAGGCHRKFMRMIIVSVDITAPLYWWKEFDTYKVGTVANSESTMHKLAEKEITTSCFEMDDYDSTYFPGTEWDRIVMILNFMREKYKETGDKHYWKELIRMLPESWLQKRTVTMNYENILQMIMWRSSHKLSEWSVSFMEWAHTLPYAEELLFIFNDKSESD